MRIVYRVQHAAGRNLALDRLLPFLPPAVEVVTDHEVAKPNPMRNYLRCLQDPPDCTHLVILQDDALPTSNFATKVEQAITEKPDVMVSLFVGGLTNRTRVDFYKAMGRGDSWSPIYFRDIHHVVGLVWPLPMIHAFLAWYPEARVPGPQPPRSDDAVVGFWMRRTRQQAWATVPCLVEHPDDMGRVAVKDGDGRPGTPKGKGRHAIWWVDE